MSIARMEAQAIGAAGTAREKPPLCELCGHCHAVGAGCAPLCTRCNRHHYSTVSCAPCLWAGEDPDTVPAGQLREPTETERKMGMGGGRGE